MSARTIKLGATDSLCEQCLVEEVNPPFLLEAQIEVSANGFAQMCVLKCSKHGPVKRLYSARPDPVFKALYPEFFGIEAKEPKLTRWF